VATEQWHLKMIRNWENVSSSGERRFIGAARLLRRLT